MGSLKLAAAYDAAFCFYYGENLRVLERAGFEIAYFSPLDDRSLPGGASGIYLGGGYPELHVERLSGNKEMIGDIRRCVSDKMPVVAECGGFMYLTDSISDGDGQRHGMCGLIDTPCGKKDRLVRFGYVEISDGTGLWLNEGESIRGHEFHYYDAEDNGEGALIRKASSGKQYREVHITDTMWAGWPHLYFRSCPGFVRSFAEKCRRYDKDRST